MSLSIWTKWNGVPFKSHFSLSSILVFSVSSDMPLLISHNFSPKYTGSFTTIISFDCVKLWKTEWVNWSKVVDKGPGGRRGSKWRNKAVWRLWDKGHHSRKKHKDKKIYSSAERRKVQMKGSSNTWENDDQHLILILSQFTVHVRGNGFSCDSASCLPFKPGMTVSQQCTSLMHYTIPVAFPQCANYR